MRFNQIKTFLLVSIFTSSVLFADEPPALEVAPPPQLNAEEVVVPSSTAVQAMESIPNVATKKDIDRSTDIFLKGGFCVITAVLFLAGFLAVKSNSGIHTSASS